MGIRIHYVLSAAAAAVAMATTLPAKAQDLEAVEVGEIQTIPAGFRELFFNYSGDFYENRTIPRQGDFLLGFRGRFPEQEIVWDSESVHEAYEIHMALQNNTTPLIRVPDLPNPYTASLLTSPGYVGSATITGSEFIYEFAPMP